MQQQPYYNGLASSVNGKADLLQPGEFRYGNIRMYPKTNEQGEAIVRLHVTNEVDMYVVKNRLALIKAFMWLGITALTLATGSGLLVYFSAH